MRAAYSLALLILVVLGSCTVNGDLIAKRDWQKLSQRIHERYLRLLASELKDDRRIDDMLQGPLTSGVPLGDLSELKNAYYSQYVEPMLDDAITEGLDRLIKSRVAHLIGLSVDGHRHPPTETYVITAYDAASFQGQLENGYADDSIHIPEFPESYPAGFVALAKDAAFRLEIDPRFSVLVGPHRYEGHSWQAVALVAGDDGRYQPPANFYQDVVFIVIAEKAVAKRQYKVIWVLDGDRPQSFQDGDLISHNQLSRASAPSPVLPLRGNIGALGATEARPARKKPSSNPTA